MKKCQYCGREFKTGYRGRRKFCSDKCAREHWTRKNNNKRRKNRKCQTCGRTIEGNGHFYCSDECRKAKQSKHNYASFLFSNSKEENPSIEICLNCKKSNCTGTCELIDQVRSKEEAQK